MHRKLQIFQSDRNKKGQCGWLGDDDIQYELGRKVKQLSLCLKMSNKHHIFASHSSIITVVKARYKVKKVHPGITKL